MMLKTAVIGIQHFHRQMAFYFTDVAENLAHVRLGTHHVTQITHLHVVDEINNIHKSQYVTRRAKCS